MDRLPRVAVVLALVVGLLATGPSAGIGVVADPADTAADREGPAPADPATTPTAAPAETPRAGATDADATRTTTGSGDAGGSTDRDRRAVAPLGALPVANETPNHLDLGGGRTRSAIATPTPDLAASLSAGDGELKSGFVAYLARQRLAEAESDDRRRAALREILDLIEDRIESLKRREDTAILAYHNGSIDDRELLRRLGSIDAEAGALRAALTDVEERNFDVTSFSFRFTTLSLDLQSMEGPVRDRVGRALRGDTAPFRVHVAATGQGLSLSTVAGGVYTREAVRLDHYDPDGAVEFTLSETTGELADLYPNSYDSAALTPVGSRLFQVRWPHRGGTGATVLYFDRTTGEVYRETQRLRLSRIPNGTVALAAREDVRLAVNRTDGIDGLYRVSVTNATGALARDVAVSLDGEPVGRTGDDGVLWTLAADRSFNVSVSVGGEPLNVSVGGST